jgi:hypothetical protein
VSTLPYRLYTLNLIFLVQTLDGSWYLGVDGSDGKHNSHADLVSPGLAPFALKYSIWGEMRTIHV